MKAILVAAGVAGAAIAGAILYMKKTKWRRSGVNGFQLPGKKADGQIREMKYSMG